LVKAGFDVHAVARRPVETQEAVTWHGIDLLDRVQMQHLVKNLAPSHLLHFAWYAEPGRYWTAPENLDWLRASLALLQDFVLNGGRRAVMAGTCAEYDWSGGVCDEASTALVPGALYGTCKHALQQVLATYSRQSGLSSAWGRIFFPYGPYEHPSRLVSSVTCALLEGRPAPCTSGEQKRDFIYVGDVAGAFVALLNSNIEGAVNIGSGRSVSVKDVVTRIAKRLDRMDLLRLGALSSQQSEPPLVVADIRRLENEVRWHSTMSLDAGIGATIDWWRARQVVALKPSGQ
jgi:nucleoside-diphosphate-sugar epimerase